MLASQLTFFSMLFLVVTLCNGFHTCLCRALHKRSQLNSNAGRLSALTPHDEEDDWPSCSPRSVKGKPKAITSRRQAATRIATDEGSSKSLAESDYVDDLGLQSDKFRSGFVSILGNPNVGKSTLMNRLLGENLCIVSPKPQTTRHRILGILTVDPKKPTYGPKAMESAHIADPKVGFVAVAFDLHIV
jgi:hypothetical protein